MKKPLWTALSVAIPLLLASAACRPNQSVERQTKDAAIEAAIKTRLASEVGASTITAVEVNVTNGAVTLAGPVGSAEDRQRIEDIARSVDGVVSVSNNLQVTTTQVVTPADMLAAPTPIVGAPIMTPVAMTPGAQPPVTPSP